jgi:predicted O-linked N-acetylglucosamine transferase (SPINDLY family)
MPHSYQANDSTKEISKKIFTKKELGLPEDSFVFCCFNQSYKINPETFDLWIEILANVNQSVLWLFETDPIASKNLKKEIKLKGLDPSRIIFAKKMPLSDHLARHQLASLSIDSFPYTTGVTCSDALWAGLPVLTRIGNSFASRMAASLLTAIGLTEMIVKTKKEYKDLAIEIATNKEKLNQIKNKLQKNRLTNPLFDTNLFTKNIEELYSIMYQRYHSDLPADHIEIE